MTFIAKLHQLGRKQTVFSTHDFKTMLNITNNKQVYNLTSYAVKQGYLYKITKGFFAIDEHYSKLEFANKYRQPSYISLYTVLQQKGIIFQHYQTIYIISRRSETLIIDNQKYVYRKIKDEILLNPQGIVIANNTNIATPERAICDLLYLYGETYFDNLRNINWSLLQQINKEVYFNHPTITKFIESYLPSE